VYLCLICIAIEWTVTSVIFLYKIIMSINNIQFFFLVLIVAPKVFPLIHEVVLLIFFISWQFKPQILRWLLVPGWWPNCAPRRLLNLLNIRHSIVPLMEKINTRSTALGLCVARVVLSTSYHRLWWLQVVKILSLGRFFLPTGRPLPLFILLKSKSVNIWRNSRL